MVNEFPVRNDIFCWQEMTHPNNCLSYKVHIGGWGGGGEGWGVGGMRLGGGGVGGVGGGVQYRDF